ncbi:MAG TPA: hypothetical protein VEW69_06970 [Alphaproteobacteria bacterium]|nr:hypothetical protein [Alphaproteobacteria bacterium]
MQPLRLEFLFPKKYEVKVLDSAPLTHPLEKLHHFPAELEEGDRSGAYLRVVPQSGPAWAGFFALGFDSDQVIHTVCSCPDPDSLCAVIGGYAYVVKAANPSQWLRVEGIPVTTLRAITDLKLLLFAGFTTITALGPAGLLWTTERLSWDGITLAECGGHFLNGFGWDAMTGKEVAFEVDLTTGKHRGGARPGPASR